MRLKEARQHIGHAVIWQPYNEQREQRTEHGVITRVNDTMIFIRTSARMHSMAAQPGDVQLVDAPKGRQP